MASTIQVDVQLRDVFDEIDDSQLLAELKRRGAVPDAAGLKLDEWTLEELIKAVHTDDGRRVVDLLRPLICPFRPLPLKLPLRSATPLGLSA